MLEEWRNVPSMPGLKASSLGRIQLPQRDATMPHGGKRAYLPKPTYGVIRRAKKGAAHRYYGIYAKFYGNIKVHRAVCEAFHGQPPFPGAMALHKDEDGLNNRKENLFWGTQKENLNMPGFLAYCRSRTGENNPRTKGRKS